MKKSLFILSFLATAWLNAGTTAHDVNDHADFPVKIERSTFKTEKIKAEFLNVQLQQVKSKDLDRSIKLLKELKPVIEKMENDLKQK